MIKQHPAKILVVEDDPDLADMLCMFLNDNDCITTHAEDGRQALEILKSTQPDLLILDIILPHIDGITLLSKIRREGCTVPVILLTEKKSVENILNGYDNGADDYITKPFNPRELLNRTHTVLQRYYGNNTDPIFLSSYADGRSPD